MQQLTALPSLWWAAALVPLGFLAWRRPVWLVAVFFVAGVVWISFRAGLILEESLPTALEGQDLVIEGHVADIPSRTDFGWRFPFDVTAARHADATVQIPARILLSAGRGEFVPRAGEAWRLTARLKRPHGLQNPGGFDYEAHLFRNRLRATGYVRLDDTPQRLGEATPTRYAIDRVRQRLGEAMRARLGDNPFAGIVVALANGDSGGVDNAQWDIFRRTGTLHLVAISGLHISLIGGIGFFLGRWLWALPGYTVLRYPAPVVGAVCALLAAAGYAALAGFVIPTQRALIMLGVVMGGILLRRQTAPTQLLAIALLAVLTYDPLAVMAAGFWLSFAAVAVILFVAHGESRRMEWWRKWGYLQIAIALGMLPLMFALFQQASLVAPLANLLAVPVFDLLMVPLVLAGLAFLGFLPSVAQTLFELTAGLLAQLWPVLEWLGSLAWSQWTRPALPELGAGLCRRRRRLAVGAAWLAGALDRRGVVAAAGVAATAGAAQRLAGRGLVHVAGRRPGFWRRWCSTTASHTLVFDAGPRLGAFDVDDRTGACCCRRMVGPSAGWWPGWATFARTCWSRRTTAARRPPGVHRRSAPGRRAVPGRLPQPFPSDIRIERAGALRRHRRAPSRFGQCERSSSCGCARTEDVGERLARAPSALLASACRRLSQPVAQVLVRQGFCRRLPLN